MKNFFIFIFISLASNFVFSQNSKNLPKCDVTPSGLCYYKNFVFLGSTQTKDWYEGELLNNKFHGKGSYFHNEEGQFKGDRVEGQFLNGEISKGTYFFSNGSKYSGTFKDGLRHGFGKEFIASGDSYEGIYSNGIIQGKGTYIWSNGDKYVGSFHNARRNGFGIAYFAKERFEGNFKDDEYHGVGTYFHASGDVSTAEYILGKRSGLGIYLFKNGEKYVGEYLNDKRDGLGILYGVNSNIVSEGIWRDNKFVSAKNVPTDVIQKATSLTPSQKSTAKNQSSSNTDLVKRCQDLGILQGSPDFALCLRSLKK